MSTRLPSLTFRATTREVAGISAHVSIGERDAPSVQFSALAAGAGGRVSSTIVDVSEGGLGVITPVYIPRWCEVLVSITSPDNPSQVVFEANCVVRGVHMVDRRPSYMLGLGFNDLTELQRASLRTLIDTEPATT